jgi:hypothetical protein
LANGQGFALVAEKLREHRIGGMLKGEDLSDEFAASLDKDLWMHWCILASMNPDKPQPDLFISPQRYRHYKGGLYEVMEMALHSETLETLVVYRNLQTGLLWVRPAPMFLEEVMVDGVRQLRFTPIE